METVCFSAFVRYSYRKSWPAVLGPANWNQFRQTLPYAASQDERRVITPSYLPLRCFSSRIHVEKPKDLYTVLNVSPSATQQQVKDAYYDLSMKYHPDRNMGSAEAHKEFTNITSAYSILGQYQLRKKYDKGLIQDYPEPPRTTHQSSEFTKQRKSTPFTEKDKVKFNFDEFYRAHYGAALSRQRAEKKKKEEERELSTYYVVPQLTQQFWVLATSLTLMGLGFLYMPDP